MKKIKFPNFIISNFEVIGWIKLQHNDLYANIWKEKKLHLIKLSSTPHYNFFINKDIYNSYHNKYIKHNHVGSIEAINKSIKKKGFDVRFPIFVEELNNSGKFLIIDGLHRASVLFKNDKYIDVMILKKKNFISRIISKILK